MLDHHPEIAFPGEFEFAVERMGPQGEFPELADYRVWLDGNRHVRWHRLTIDPKLSYPELVASFLAQMKTGGGGAAKAQVGVAVHRRFECLERLWPEARYLHLVRDGRDVAESLIAHGWAGNHLTAARQWRETELAWERARARIPAERTLDVRFEDLVAAPRPTLERICAFLGVAFRDEMLRYPEDTTYAAPDPASAGRWMRSLPARAVRLCEAGAGDLLERRGYAPSGLAPIAIGPALDALLGLHCRLARLRFRLRRYGVRLWLERRIATALGLDAWRRSVRLREHEITNRHLQ